MIVGFASSRVSRQEYRTKIPTSRFVTTGELVVSFNQGSKAGHVLSMISISAMTAITRETARRTIGLTRFGKGSMTVICVIEAGKVELTSVRVLRSPIFLI